uniref:Uncharacterized protein n=1 Tax=Arundo donax TaxID=35708 RepID=A0A0A8Z470_ARUDO
MQVTVATSDIGFDHDNMQLRKHGCFQRPRPQSLQQLPATSSSTTTVASSDLGFNQNSMRWWLLATLALTTTACDGGF